MLRAVRRAPFPFREQGKQFSGATMCRYGQVMLLVGGIDADKNACLRRLYRSVCRYPPYDIGEQTW